jgi:RNA polymerase sigma-70 factor (ECF subfamily)
MSERPSSPPLLSDEPTVELVLKARDGNRLAVEALLERCLPRLKRWAHGRLPSVARGSLETGDIVQETAMHVLRNLEHFEPRHVGAMQAYLRQAVINRIRDEMRRVGRQGAPQELPDQWPSDDASPLEVALASESYERYRQALAALSAKDRELVVARVEGQWSADDIAQRFRLPSAAAARMAISRALRKLTSRMSPGSDKQG